MGENLTFKAVGAILQAIKQNLLWITFLPAKYQKEYGLTDASIIGRFYFLWEKKIRKQSETIGNLTEDSGPTTLPIPKVALRAQYL